ncbi:Uncharacterised protein [Legionella feeleii]|uniref:Uncharacterized protein n=1 Tax=Legionella feeleii TaxID=453 RepID=A0A2X1QW00_9GAMM|nr:Uncharacterised protein [Legionella feeleii]
MKAAVIPAVMRNSLFLPYTDHALFILQQAFCALAQEPVKSTINLFEIPIQDMYAITIFIYPL